MPLSKRKVTSADDLSSAEETSTKKARTLKPTKGIAGGEKGKPRKDDEGNIYWELTGRRRVTISEYKGARMVGIREYYEKDGKEMPGKKGIQLPLDQFSALVSLLPQIEDQLRAKGDKLARPHYDGDSRMDEDDDDGHVSGPKKGRENHEETSDED